MDNVNEPSSVCGRCGAPLAPGSLGTICPRCLMALNLAAPTEMPTDTGGGTAETKTAKPPVAPVAPAVLARHFPQLEILECLGRGGMGVVYRARQIRLNRPVALKILAPEKEKESAFAERFAREAQALARLNHPNIVTVYDFGEADGLYYLLMEYVDGVSLRQLLQTRKITPERALAIVPRVCEALEFAHELGIVHRDIKPENILLDKQGRVKIADFGIAKLIGEPAGAETLTAEQQVVGTPHYMAPEQVERPRSVDHRADIYSLGVVFYEMLTGELPLGKFAPPSRKVHVDVRLDEVVLHALEKEPGRRYQHASEVKTDVETIAADTGSAQKTVPAAAHVPSQSAAPAPATGFSSRLSRFAAAEGSSAAWLGDASIGLACLSGILGVIAWASMPTPSQLVVWSILVAAVAAVLLSIPSRHTGSGRSGLIVGALNIAVWVIVAAAFGPPNRMAARRPPPRSPALQLDSALGLSMGSSGGVLQLKLPTTQRQFVCIVGIFETNALRLSFQGQPTTWEELPALLEKVPNRPQTVLEYAVSSDQIPLPQYNEFRGRVARLAKDFRFEYASDVGIRSPLTNAPDQ